ncbi:MAG: hypothetical protein U0353_28745 [Sandaracinus sp.]
MGPHAQRRCRSVRAEGPRGRIRAFWHGIRGVAVVACLALALPAQAQDSPADVPLVAWEAPPTCPSRAVFEAEVERILGRRPSGGPYADITVVAHGARHTAVLVLGARRRRIEGASCEAIVRASALIVALEIDPDALSIGDEPEPPPPPPEPPLAELEGGVELDRAVGPDPARRLASPFPPGSTRGPTEPPFRFLGGAGLALDSGAMPGLAPGVWLGASGRVAGLLELGLEVRILPEQRARLAPRPQVGADVSLVAGRVRVGLGIVVARLGVASFEVAPLVALELGSVSGTAVGLMTPLSASSLWLAADAGMELRAFFWDALGVFVRGELEITLKRSSFVVEGYSTPVFRADDAGFVGIAGILLRTS